MITRETVPFRWKFKKEEKKFKLYLSEEEKTV